MCNSGGRLGEYKICRSGSQVGRDELDPGPWQGCPQPSGGEPGEGRAMGDPASVCGVLRREERNPLKPSPAWVRLTGDTLPSLRSTN